MIIKDVELDKHAVANIIPNNIYSENNVLVTWLGGKTAHIIEFNSSGMKDKRNITFPFDCQLAPISSFLPNDTTIIYYPFIKMPESNKLLVYGINNSIVNKTDISQCLPGFPLYGIKLLINKYFSTTSPKHLMLQEILSVRNIIKR